MSNFFAKVKTFPIVNVIHIMLDFSKDKNFWIFQKIKIFFCMELLYNHKILIKNLI